MFALPYVGHIVFKRYNVFFILIYFFFERQRNPPTTTTFLKFFFQRLDTRREFKFHFGQNNKFFVIDTLTF